MSILMDGRDCMSCACSHWENSAKMVLYCVKNDMHPHKTDYCKNYERSQHDEKLVLNLQFVRVLKLLQLC